MNESLLLQEVGKVLKIKRRELQISQEELAWRCGITKNGLGKIELGRSQVRITTLFKIMRELRLTINDLESLQPHLNPKK